MKIFNDDSIVDVTKDGENLQLRVTFLVNVWLNHKPSGINPFPLDKIKLKSPDIIDSVFIDSKEENIL